MSYCCSLNFNDNYELVDTLEEAILTLIDNIDDKDYLYQDDKGTFFIGFIGEAESYEDTIDVDWVIENLQNQALYDDPDDYSENYLENISEENKKWLQNKLDEIWQEFKRREEINSPYFTSNNIKKYKIYIKEIAEFNYKLISYEEF